jgi:hypothetical protein
VRQIAPDIKVYKAVVGKDLSFAYLYLYPSIYALAWSAPHDFTFTAKMPYTFIEMLFNSKMETRRIEELNLILPKTRRHPDYFFAKATATLILTVGDKKSKVEYDLLNTEARKKYVKLLDESELISSISLARYDSSVVYNNDIFDCCFTMESPSSADSEDWELLVNLPRKLKLTEREMVWIVKHHRIEALKSTQKMNIKDSLAELSRILDQQEVPQPESVPT